MGGYYFKTYKKEREAADAFLLRNQIFVQEQGIPEHLDVDRYDPHSFHLVAYTGMTPVGTGRLTLREKKAILSRIAVIPAERGKGLGAQIIKRLEKMATENGFSIFVLRPHTYLENFYKSLGYVVTKDRFEIGGVELLEMEKSLQS